MLRNPIDVVTVSKIQKIIEPYINTIILNRTTFLTGKTMFPKNTY